VRVGAHFSGYEATDQMVRRAESGWSTRQALPIFQPERGRSLCAAQMTANGDPTVVELHRSFGGSPPDSCHSMVGTEPGSGAPHAATYGSYEQSFSLERLSAQSVATVQIEGLR
jgi:hypothetical protein